MIDFSASIELMFAEVGDDPAERVRAAAASGFPAVEIWEWSTKDLAQLGRALSETSTRLATMCVEPFVNLSDRSSHPVLFAGTAESAAIARDLGCSNLVMQVRKRLPDVPYVTQRTAVVDAIRGVAEVAGERDVTVLVEIVNDLLEGPDNFLLSTPEAVAIIDEVASPHAKVLYDRYHTYLNGELTGQGLAGRMDVLGHVQVADVPGRHEFGTGELDWVTEIAWLIEQGYDGLIGIEAVPLADSSTVYGKAREVLASATRGARA